MTNDAPYRVFSRTGKRAHLASPLTEGFTRCGVEINTSRLEEHKLRTAPLCYRCERRAHEQAEARPPIQGG